ncbi:MAG: hypothetical protein OIF47_08685 [Marinibacterium sp.]|nr:hypothetical protein [Marinibacterium sp.]
MAWGLASGLPLIGIDDAAITRSYADNIARGLGYVYNAGGEHVEGSTTFLWVSILTGLYALTPTPEIAILCLCFAITVSAVYMMLRFVRLLALRMGVDPSLAVGFAAVLLLINPGYFFWSVWSMMELALWSLMLLAMLYALALRVDDETPAAAGSWLMCVTALLLPLTRPEGIAAAIGLLLLALALSPHRWRGYVAGIGLAVGSFVAVTAFRLIYFGQPFPNTFYAKVSTDRLHDLKDGVKYLASFVLQSPFAELFVALWVGAVVWALWGLRRAQSGQRLVLLGGALMLGGLMVYAVLGGDHFALWRFYQPIAPLLPVFAALGLAWAVTQLLRGGGPKALIRAPVVAAWLAAVAMGWLHYYQARFDVIKEYTLVETGLSFGEFLNTVSPRPSIGVGAAGGIALTYDGYIYDLLGLNWTEMAHANPIKVGMRNHASFDKTVFWAHPPDVVSIFNKPCLAEGADPFWAVDDTAFHGLATDADFRARYQPVTFVQRDRCWPGYATPDWLAQAEGQPGVAAYDWADTVLGGIDGS